MPKLIQDEFTQLPISRQRKYQLRHAKERMCKACSVKLRHDWPHQLCSKHLESQKKSVSRYFQHLKMIAKHDDIL